MISNVIDFLVGAVWSCTGESQLCYIQNVLSAIRTALQLIPKLKTSKSSCSKRKFNLSDDVIDQKSTRKEVDNDCEPHLDVHQIELSRSFLWFYLTYVSCVCDPVKADLILAPDCQMLADSLLLDDHCLHRSIVFSPSRFKRSILFEVIRSRSESLSRLTTWTITAVKSSSVLNVSSFLSAVLSMWGLIWPFFDVDSALTLEFDLIHLTGAFETDMGLINCGNPEVSPLLFILTFFADAASAALSRHNMTNTKSGKLASCLSLFSEMLHCSVSCRWIVIAVPLWLSHIYSLKVDSSSRNNTLHDNFTSYVMEMLVTNILFSRSFRSVKLSTEDTGSHCEIFKWASYLLYSADGECCSVLEYKEIANSYRRWAMSHRDTMQKCIVMLAAFASSLDLPTNFSVENEFAIPLWSRTKNTVAVDFCEQSVYKGCDIKSIELVMADVRSFKQCSGTQHSFHKWNIFSPGCHFESAADSGHASNYLHTLVGRLRLLGLIMCRQGFRVDKCDNCIGEVSLIERIIGFIQSTFLAQCIIEIPPNSFGTYALSDVLCIEFCSSYLAASTLLVNSAENTISINNAVSLLERFRPLTESTSIRNSLCPRLVDTQLFGSVPDIILRASLKQVVQCVSTREMKCGIESFSVVDHSILNIADPAP